MRILKRLGVYGLILAMLFYVTPLQQFLKVPALLDHYAEHKQNKPNLTFLHFLFMHYIGDDGVSNDDNKDMSLPFKKSNTGSSMHDVNEPSIATLIPNTRCLTTGFVYCQFRPQFFPDAHKSTLLKPPRA